jgi:regulator of cell morphogenesis and NO signaling
MTITAETTVGAVATEHPLAARVFARHGIDFCCGGGRPLAEACGAKGVEVARVLAELEEEIVGRDEPEVRWDQQPLDDLIDHILATYHMPLRAELPRIEEMMRKVHSVHGDKDQARFDELLEVVLAIKGDMEQHMPKEEEILFPMIKSGQGAMAEGPIEVMELEHEALGNLLRKARSLTNDYVAPAEACNTWRALWSALEDLERETHKHIHLENNILHVRVRQQ